MIYISAFLIGALNALRGSNFSEGKWYDIFFTKWLVLGYIFLLAFINLTLLFSLVFITPILFWFATGTGGNHQAFTDGIINPKEFAPFDWVATLLTDKEIDSLGDARKWGVWYGSLIGLVFYLPFLALEKYFIGLPLLGLGLYCGALRYFNHPYKWQFIEFGYLFLYSILFLV